MENSKNKVEAVQEEPNATNPSSTGADTDEKLVDELQSPNLFKDLPETSAVDEHRHHHHESLDIARLENSDSALRVQFAELIRERDELRRINDSCNQQLLLCKNHIKQLTVENNKLKVKIISKNAALRDTIDDLILQLNDSNENDLDEDCLLKIFSYLSVDDMMQVKRVCKQWYQVSQQWFKQVQTLVYHAGGRDSPNVWVYLYEKYYGRKVYEKKDIHGFNDIISILHSCGHYIKYFKADIFKSGNPLPEECRKFIFQWVPQLCKNIVDVEFNGAGLCGNPMKLNCEFMAKHWEELQKIKIKYVTQTVDEDFLKLLRNNNQLNTLRLEYDENFEDPINGDFLTCLPKTITEISLRYTQIADTEILSSLRLASENFTSLQSLELTVIDYLSDAMAAVIANITSLTHLSLNCVYRYESRNTINQIANLQGLKSLSLQDNLGGLYEDNIINIVESCTQLEALRIPTECKLRDRGLAVIAKMKKLKCLEEIDCSNLTVESIINSCYRLEVLSLYNSKMNNRDAIKLLKKASNLRCVNFDDCKNLTQDILQEANTIANERKNNILVIRPWCIWPVDGEYKAFSDGYPEEIDTPYFKYFKYNRMISSGIFPEDIETFIKDEIL